MAENNLQRKVMRLSIIGDSQTGKSSILNVYLGNDFTYDILSNIGIDKQSVEKQMKDGNKIKIIFWDTAGQERFHSLSSGTIKNSQGIIICFALNDKQSFENVVLWLEDVRNVSEKIPIVLFGNKCDLVDERKVTKEEIDRFVKKNDLVYFETSAKEKINLEEGFQKIFEDAYATVVEQNAKFELLRKKEKDKKKKKC
jgi:small GTP-binding protein